jgi:hypothetical protein
MRMRGRTGPPGPACRRGQASAPQAGITPTTMPLARHRMRSLGRVAEEIADRLDIISDSL